MALTKADLIATISEELDLPKNKSTDAVKSLLEIIKSTLEKGADVLISGFGKFYVRDKKQRKGRNPATGDDLMLPSRRVVIFKWSGRLRDKLNGIGNMLSSK